MGAEGAGLVAGDVPQDRHPLFPLQHMHPALVVDTHLGWVEHNIHEVHPAFAGGERPHDVAAETYFHLVGAAGWAVGHGGFVGDAHARHHAPAGGPLAAFAANHRLHGHTTFPDPVPPAEHNGHRPDRSAACSRRIRGAVPDHRMMSTNPGAGSVTPTPRTPARAHH